MEKEFYAGSKKRGSFLDPRQTVDKVLGFSPGILLY